jgi:nitric oxide reductase NorD protein
MARYWPTVENQLESDAALHCGRINVPLRAYATGWGDKPSPAPWTTHHTADDSICLPDVYDALAGEHPVSGIDRYRVALAHMAAHRRWSQPLVADNLSPLQRLTIECLEDARVDHLVLRQYPGMRPLLLALHPAPVEGACDPATASCLRHRLAMLSRALLDPAHGYHDEILQAFANDFTPSWHTAIPARPRSPGWRCAMRPARAARATSPPACSSPTPWSSYRDDNRHLWTFHRGRRRGRQLCRAASAAAQDIQGLPPRHYPEWDAAAQDYRPTGSACTKRCMPAATPA